jgi:drug/metabolite transporter (DMT)-like permease
LDKTEPPIEPGGIADGPPDRLSGRFWAWSVLFSIGIAWGFTVVLAKVIVSGGAHPFGVALWTSMLGAGLLLAMSAARRRRVSLKRNVAWLYVVCGLLGVVIPAISIYFAASRLSAGVLAITVTTGPILTFLFLALFGLERIASVRALGVLFGVLAVALLVLPETSLPDAAVVPWGLLACVPGLCYALENVVLTFFLPEDASPFMITCGNYFVSSIVLACVVMASDSFVALAWPWGAVEWAIVGMAVINAVGYGLFIYLIAYAGAVFATQVAYLVTVSGVLWGIVIFNEQHSLWVWLSLACMLVGLTLVRPRRREPVAE